MVVFHQRTLKEKLLIFLINTLLLYIPLLALTDGWNYEQRDEYTYCVWTGGTFFQLCCCVVSVFGSGGKQVLVLHTYLLRVQYSCGVVLVCWFWQEIVFGVMYVLSVQYSSCVVVSGFWLWREIGLKMRTRFYKKTLLGYFIMICQPMCIFHKA